MKRWTHLHTLAAGGTGGMLFATHAWAPLLACFIGGVLVGRFWNLLHWAGEALRSKVMHAKRDRELHLKTKPRPVYTGRDEIPY